MTETVLTPECDKLASVSEKSQIVGEFLEWLGSEEIFLCKLNNHKSRFSDEDVYERVLESTEKLLATFFGIDLREVEKERRTMLEALREKNKQREEGVRHGQIPNQM